MNLQNDLAERILAEHSSCVYFIIVDVSKCSILVAYTSNNLVKDKTALAAHFELNDLLVNYADLGSIFGSHVDMTLSNDAAFSDFNFAFRTYDLAACRACKVTAFADGAVKTESASVCEGQLNLVCLAAGTEDGHCCLTFGTYNCDLVGSCELTGLGKILLVLKLKTLAEKNVDSLSCEVAVLAGALNDYLEIFHIKIPPSVY